MISTKKLTLFKERIEHNLYNVPGYKIITAVLKENQRINPNTKNYKNWTEHSEDSGPDMTPLPPLHTDIVKHVEQADGD